MPQLTCPFDSQQDGIIATVTDAVRGTVLATVSSGIQRIPANGPAVRGGLP